MFKTGKDYKSNLGDKYPIFGSSKTPMKFSSSDYLYNSPSFILGRKGTIDQPFKIDTPFWCVDTAMYFDAKNHEQRDFVFYSILGIDFMKYNRGAVLPSLIQSEVNNISLLCPSEEIQKSIASILSHQESIINDMETLVEKYETRQRYLSEELLSGRLRIKEVDGKTVFYKNTEWKEVEINGEIKEIPVDWEVDKVCNFIELMSEGGTPPSGDDKYYKNGKILWVVVEDIKKDIVSSKKQINELGLKKIGGNLWIPGDVLMSTGATIGNVGIVRENLATKQGISGFRADKKKVNQLFLYFLFKNNRDLFIRHANGSTFKSLPQKDIKPLEFIIPSKNEQSLFSIFLEDFEKFVEMQRELLEREKKKFDFLLNKLISGNYLIEDVN